MSKRKFKCPWGILSGISLMVSSLAAVAVIVVKVISYLMILAADGDDGLGNSPWIPWVTALAILFFVAFVVFLILYKVEQKRTLEENRPQTIIKRSAMVLITTYVFTWLAILGVGGNILLNDFSQNINTALGLTGTREEVLDSDEEVDSEYHESEFVKKDANGNPIYVTDANGYTHQQYDHAALREATVDLAEQVQREGSTLLWNNNANGLPLAEGKKVSLFSHSSVDWLESGGGSGISQVNSNSTLFNELTNAGLSVNKTLWDFYKNVGTEYNRVGNAKMNDVPWANVNSACSGSFSQYGDAAIIVISRLTREGSTGGNGGDAVLTGADTATGDYFDFSNEEEQLLSGVLKLKADGVFKKVIVLLNTPTAVFMDTLVANQSKIDSCLWVGMTGYQGLHEVANIIAGKSIPSGHLVDTFAFNTASAPSAVNIQAKAYTNNTGLKLESNSKQGYYITYAEGIYVGYKYYETRYEDTVLNRGNAASTAGVKNSSSNWKYSEEVAFPFGHGAAYTTFEFSDYDVSLNENGNYDVTIKVTNTGNKQGKDVAQIYVQKPYTQYDIDNGIEQASVNLAGYAKTKMLEPGESQVLSIEVRDDAFKTYDANNKKTYIREKTSGLDAYYIAAGHDSHDAINNILAAKGKTPSNTMSRMDAEGDASLVKKFDFAEDDFTSYSQSGKTGYPITNQFDDVDWNKYENKSENNVTYLSRNDWKKTYPVSTVSLGLTAKMIDDLAYNHTFEADPNDVMPKYNQYSKYVLVDLIGADYDDPMWDELLNSLSIDDQINLLGSAYFGTIALPKIGKPSDVAADGPMGLRRSMTYDTSIKTMSYPSPTLMAATFNDDIALRVGELMGEDALHSGCTGLYAPGVNMHRSIYGARNWEYHSEDSFLSGMIGKYRVIGAQSKGCYVNMKHFALNDQESYRHGVNIWCNEQALREIYLNAYEYAAVEGDCSGFMTAFSRFGTHWSGAHRGLCTEVVRNEWGVKGFIVSDSAWQVYMGVIDGVMAGNDCILYNVDKTMYDSAKTNPTIAKAVRESTHRILYVIANSNAMNGISVNVVTFEVLEWWQILTINVQAGATVFAVGMAIITALVFIFYKPIAVENKKNKEAKKAIKEAKEAGKDIKDIKQPPFISKHLFKTLLAASITITTLVSSLIGIASMKELYPDYTSENKTLREQVDVSSSLNKLEAESAIIETDISTLVVGNYIDKIGDSGDLTLVFNYISSTETKAVLGMNFKKSDETVAVGSMFDIYVNGVMVSPRKLKGEVPALSEENPEEWTDVDTCLANIKEGLNVIKLVKKSDAPRFLPLDYLYLYTESEIEFETREYKLYSFDTNDDLDPFVEKHGGSLTDDDSTYKVEGSAGLYRYGNLNEAILTSTVVVEEDVIVTMYTIGDCRPGRGFAYYSSSSNPYIANFSLNDGEGQFIPSEKSYTALESWNIYRNFEIATLYLKAGENHISFQIGGDNVNICGLTFSSPIEIKLKNQGKDNPPQDEEFDAYKLEVEDAIIDTNISILGIGYEGRTPEQTNYPSGSGFIYNVNKEGYCTITFKFTSSIATTATFGACFGRREYSRRLDQMYNISVNGTPLNYGNINIDVMKEGGVKYYDWFNQDIADISLKQGSNTITLTKVENADRILNLDYIYLDCKSVIELEGEKQNTYVFNTNYALDPSNPENECNPFATCNGGSVTDSDGNYYDEKANVFRYGNANGAVATVTLNASNAAKAVFSLISDCRPGKIFSATQVASGEPTITAFTVNGSTANVVKSIVQYPSQGWHVHRACELATIQLAKGKNVISFTIGGDNINFSGIQVMSSASISLNNNTDVTYFYNTNFAIDPSNPENEWNPFATCNGGSISDANNDTNYIAENNNDYRYGYGNQTTATCTLTANAPTTVTFYLLADCRPDKTFSATQVASGEPCITEIKVNGETTGVSKSTKTYLSEGWNIFNPYELATIQLKAGKNVISFTIGGDNINFCGVAVTSSVKITLG